MEQEINESNEDYLKRLFSKVDRSTKNFEQIKKDMKENNVIGFCKECGCNLYSDREHKCE